MKERSRRASGAVEPSAAGGRSSMRSSAAASAAALNAVQCARQSEARRGQCAAMACGAGRGGGGAGGTGVGHAVGRAIGSMTGASAAPPPPDVTSAQRRSMATAPRHGHTEVQRSTPAATSAHLDACIPHQRRPRQAQAAQVAPARRGGRQDRVGGARAPGAQVDAVPQVWACLHRGPPGPRHARGCGRGGVGWGGQR